MHARENKYDYIQYSSKCCTRHDPNNLTDLLLDQEAKYFLT